MPDPLLVIVVCRSAEPPEEIDPRSKTGFQCAGCGRNLQVSPTGIAQLERGGKPVCNPCGTKFAGATIVAGKLAGVTINPLAREYLDKQKD